MDVSKFMGEFKIPGFNFEALMNTVQRKNIEAITAVNQAAFESFQSLPSAAKLSWMRQGFEEATSTMNAVHVISRSPEEKVIRQAEASKAVAVEKCIANARDVAEALTQCNNQAMETVSNRLPQRKPRRTARHRQDRPAAKLPLNFRHRKSQYKARD